MNGEPRVSSWRWCATHPDHDALVHRHHVPPCVRSRSSRDLRRRRLRALLHSAPGRAPSLLLSVEGGWGWCRRLFVPPGARTVLPLPALPSVRPARGRGVEVQPGPATAADTSSEATLVDPDRWRAYLVGRPRRPEKLTLRESLDTRLSTQIADLPSARRSRVTGAALALPSTDG